MDKKEIRRRLKEILFKETNIIVKSNENFKTLGIDSLALVSLIIAIEETFRITFDDSDLEPKKLISINSLTNIMERYL